MPFSRLNVHSRNKSGEHDRGRKPFLHLQNCFTCTESRGMEGDTPKTTYQDCDTGIGVGEEECWKNDVNFEWHDHSATEWLN